jgi:hypothetical protein
MMFYEQLAMGCIFVLAFFVGSVPALSMLYVVFYYSLSNPNDSSDKRSAHAFKWALIVLASIWIAAAAILLVLEFGIEMVVLALIGTGIPFLLFGLGTLSPIIALLSTFDRTCEKAPQIAAIILGISFILVFLMVLMIIG